MSDTPRTDAEEWQMRPFTMMVVKSEVSRTLERELNAAKGGVERLREALTEIIRYAKGVHDPHLEELVRDFLKEPK
jgi:hypothetical protein